MRQALLCHRHLNVLTGCLPALGELVHWLEAIVNAPRERLFLAANTDRQVALTWAGVDPDDS